MSENHNVKKLRIAVITRNVEKLRYWDFLIFNGIFEHPHLELVLLIKDGRVSRENSPQKQKKTFATRLFDFQQKIESILYPLNVSIDANRIINKLSQVQTIYLNPIKKGYLDLFSKEDYELVKSYDLDIIIRHAFNIIRGEILEAARYGIWSYHHADNAINRGGPHGFWEIINKEPCCCATLQRLTSELDGGLVIDKAWFDITKRSYRLKSNALLEKSAVMLFKNINKLLLEGELKTKKSLTYYNQLYRKPNLKFVLIYIKRFWSGFLFEKIEKHTQSLRLIRKDCWTLFFSEGIFLESALFRINPITLPKGVFWADPFLHKHNGQLYVFFENYSYKTKKGKISLGKVIKNENSQYTVTDVIDILDLDYHLSYPQIIEEDGDLFLMPETHQNKQLEIYKCVHFPEKWELFASAFDGEKIIDATYFRDNNSDKWLFLNTGYAHEAELYVYKIDSLKLENIIPHKLNPVIIDCRKGRSGGSFFMYDNNYYRPSQVKTHGIYGKGLCISKIKKLTLDEFEDEDIITIEANFRKNLVGIHHLHQLEDCFMFDACYKKLR